MKEAGRRYYSAEEKPTNEERLRLLRLLNTVLLEDLKDDEKTLLWTFRCDFSSPLTQTRAAGHASRAPEDPLQHGPDAAGGGGGGDGADQFSFIHGSVPPFLRAAMLPTPAERAVFFRSL